MPRSCALLGGFAIGAQVALLWNTRNAWQSPAVIRHARPTARRTQCRALRMPAKTTLASDNTDAPTACAVPVCSRTLLTAINEWRKQLRACMRADG